LPTKENIEYLSGVEYFWIFMMHHHNFAANNKKRKRNGKVIPNIEYLEISQCIIIIERVKFVSSDTK